MALAFFVFLVEGCCAWLADDGGEEEAEELGPDGFAPYTAMSENKRNTVVAGNIMNNIKCLFIMCSLESE